MKHESVVVVLIIHQQKLSDFELISLRQCLAVLHNYPIAVAKPASLELNISVLNDSRLQIESFPDAWFADIGMYSRLLVLPEFYRRFRNYEYMLLHQLDVFVFRDELLEWCKKDFDYVGAPWFEGFSPSDESAKLIGGGNGGFSLRKISSHLRVLRSLSYISQPAENWRNRMSETHRLGGKVHQLVGFALDLTIRNNTFWRLNTFRGFEDQFWGLVAPRNFKWFKIPESECSMKFAFEMQPARVYEMNNFQLPFGCHAWWRYDLNFWRPFIEAYGYQV